MPLPLPRPVDRTFAELVGEGRALIPRLAPEWTDHNAHDPGITLLELLAWLVEADLYRAGRIPEASYRSFLRLLGVDPRPPRLAETVLEITPDPLSGAVALPAGLQVEDAAGGVVFQTAGPARVVPARLVVVLGGCGTPLEELSEANSIAGSTFRPFGAAPRAGCALYLGFDGALQGEVTLHVWTRTHATAGAERTRLLAEWEAAVAGAAESCPPGTAVRDWREHYGVRTTWEYLTGSSEWAPLAEVEDETRALSLSGFVRFRVPAGHGTGGPAPGAYYLRCRVACGRYDCPPELERVAVNAVLARHEMDLPEEGAGVSWGLAEQAFELSRAPVVAGSVRLRLVRDGQSDDSWHEVRYWDRVGPNEPAYQLIPATGEIAFGNGLVGRVPPDGAEIMVAYATGSGPAGNLPAGRLTRFLAGGHNAALLPGWSMLEPLLGIRQPFAAAGGAKEETLEAAKARAVEEVGAVHRAVTLEDYVTLALATPGVPIARAHALAEHHPAFRCVPASGCVTVVVIPRCPDPRPEPTPALLTAVSRYLRRRRTLTTELNVIGPTYTEVAVDARLHAEPEADHGALRARAVALLSEFFHPLRGGPERSGWPVGRGVHQAEVLALLDALPGVAYVDRFGLRVGEETGARCGNLTVCPDSLVVPGTHAITVMERSTER